MPLKEHENILVFYKKLPTYNPQKTKGKLQYKKGNNAKSCVYGKVKKTDGYMSDEYYPIDTINISNIRVLNGHPTQKPVALCEYLIRTYTNENEVVLDNTMGSGTTGVACVNTGRKFIGIEKEQKYFETAQRRIAEAQKAMSEKLV